MQVSSVKSYYINKYNSSPVSMRGESHASVPNDRFESENKKKQGKFIIGAAILISVITLGIIGHKNNWFKKASTNITKPKELTFEKFKEAGNRFEKGKALNSDGSAYTGKIIHKQKDGSNLIIEYNEGIVQKSSGNKFEKIYKYDKDGRISEVEIKKDGNSKTLSYTHDNNGRLTSIRDSSDNFRTQEFVYNNDGSLKYHVKYRCIPEDTVLINNMPGMRRACVEYFPNSNKPKYIASIGKRNLSVLETYDETGKLLSEVSMHENPELIRLYRKNNIDLELGFISEGGAGYFNVLLPDGRKFSHNSCEEIRQANKDGVLRPFTIYSNNFAYSDKNGTDYKIARTVNKWSPEGSLPEIWEKKPAQEIGDIITSKGMYCFEGKTPNLRTITDEKGTLQGVYDLVNKTFTPSENCEIAQETLEEILAKRKEILLDMKNIYKQYVFPLKERVKEMRLLLTPPSQR